MRTTKSGNSSEILCLVNRQGELLLGSKSLGVYRNTALQRFASLERRLNRDADLKARYVSFMKEYEDSCI